MGAGFFPVRICGAGSTAPGASAADDEYAALLAGVVPAAARPAREKLTGWSEALMLWVAAFCAAAKAGTRARAAIERREMAKGTGETPLGWGMNTCVVYRRRMA